MITLATEIQQPAYAGMSDGEIAAALNAVSASTRRAVPLAALLATAALNGSYAAVKAAAESEAAPAQVRGVCASVLVLLSGVFQEVNLDDPRVQGALGALTQAGVLSAAQMAEIDALADAPGRSRAQELGLGVVSEADVAAARDWQAAQEAEAARLALFAALRERLVSGYLAALAQLQARQGSGAAAPAWDDVLAWM